MTLANRNIVDAYSGLFEGLDIATKSKIIENLSKSIGRPEPPYDDDSFSKTFGAFESDKTAEEIIDDIKSSRAFREKDIQFWCNICWTQTFVYFISAVNLILLT